MLYSSLLRDATSPLNWDQRQWFVLILASVSQPKMARVFRSAATTYNNSRKIQHVTLTREGIRTVGLLIFEVYIGPALNSSTISYNHWESKNMPSPMEIFEE